MWHWVYFSMHMNNEMRVRERAKRAGQSFPLIPQLSPFFPFFVPLLGTPEKAGVMGGILRAVPTLCPRCAQSLYRIMPNLHSSA